ncbi:hypothetical protein BpHYR1_003597 [Brachionus plicatilis]|uniref:Uncharacterized protein n=1 Tax=Brachionus plicatilis TaxID=10195 RepID=A0A3M7RRM8_BRAPC|nr:hypothetical protein BpHYR1_003597 [Brachionus plicatilis]
MFLNHVEISGAENSLNDAEPFENLVESTVHISSTSTNMDQTVQSTQSNDDDMEFSTKDFIEQR